VLEEREGPQGGRKKLAPETVWFGGEALQEKDRLKKGRENYHGWGETPGKSKKEFKRIKQISCRGCQIIVRKKKPRALDFGQRRGEDLIPGEKLSASGGFKGGGGQGGKALSSSAYSA